MTYRIIEMLEYGGDFFLGFCVLCGASLVFHRSKGASLFVALAGLAFCSGAAAEFMLSRAGRVAAHVPIATWNLFFSAIGAGKHLFFFGGLALALRAMATEARR